MNHGDHSGHNMPSEAVKCSMNMIFNWQIEDTCVVFRSWHISSTLGMIGSCLAVVLIALSYEWTRHRLVLYDRSLAASLMPPKANGGFPGRSSPMGDGPYPTTYTVAIPSSARITRALGYALSVFISFFLMLVFMTYNGYLILATVVGAGVGHFVYNRDMDPTTVLRDGASEPAQSLACH